MCALLCCMAAGLAAASNFETFQGDWKLLLGVQDGKPLLGKELEARLSISGDHFSVQGPVSWPLLSGTLKLDETANPKTVDLKGDDGKTALGIYEVRAGNRIRVCSAPPGAARPTRFQSDTGSGYYFQEWQRAK